MADAAKVIRGLEFCLKVACTASSGEKCPYIGSGGADGCIYEMQSDALKLLKEREKKKFFVDSDGKITPLPDVVLCKDCKWYIKKFENEGRCIKHDNDYHKPDWFCADGERR